MISLYFPTGNPGKRFINDAPYQKGVSGKLPVYEDAYIQYIQDKGTVYAFHKKYGYGLRSLVEAQIFRIKRCIGETLLTQKIESQQCEGVIIANLINLWNSLGRCSCVKASLIPSAS